MAENADAIEYQRHPGSTIHPLFVRRDSSDGAVYHQIFVQREYSCLDDMTDVQLVIDCGAYVGYSTAEFLSRHQNCQVIAVEPDPHNFALLQRNLAAYGDRVTLIRAGVWSHAVPMVISNDKYRDGHEWARQVRRAEPDENADFEGVSIESLLAGSGSERISILKVDVEGSEAVIFAGNHQSWLDRTDAIVIELHDDSIHGKGSEIFYAAIKDQGFQISQSGELTVCRRPA